MRFHHLALFSICYLISFSGLTQSSLVQQRPSQLPSRIQIEILSPLTVNQHDEYTMKYSRLFESPQAHAEFNRLERKKLVSCVLKPHMLPYPAPLLNSSRIIKNSKQEIFLPKQSSNFTMNAQSESQSVITLSEIPENFECSNCGLPKEGGYIIVAEWDGAIAIPYKKNNYFVRNFGKKIDDQPIEEIPYTFACSKFVSRTEFNESNSNLDIKWTEVLKTIEKPDDKILNLILNE